MKMIIQKKCVSIIIGEYVWITAAHIYFRISIQTWSPRFNLWNSSLVTSHLVFTNLEHACTSFTVRVMGKLGEDNTGWKVKVSTWEHEQWTNIRLRSSKISQLNLLRSQRKEKKNFSAEIIFSQSTRKMKREWEKRQNMFKQRELQNSKNNSF